MIKLKTCPANVKYICVMYYFKKYAMTLFHKYVI